MPDRAHQRGAALIIATLLLAGAIGVVLAMEWARAAGSAQRDRASDRALAAAREALLAYAADHAITTIVGPGYLPCPDLDNDGWAESTCGSMNGDSGQSERLGRLPWKTLGLPDLRDGHGERLWYAVSSKYKGLLNCGVSRACLDMSPEAALGTITVRDPAGTLIHDGTIAEPYRAVEGGAVAVVIAPGPRLERIAADGAAVEQSRECRAGDCDASARCLTDPPQLAATCDPANYLDRAGAARFAFEDNADFLDRNDAAGRARNRNGFIQGPVVLPDGRVAVNDRLAVIGYRDVMPRIMQRVALEAAHCLSRTAAANANRYPWPTPACAQASPDAATAWQARSGVFFGRIADTPFDASACSIDTASAASTWWAAWRPFVFYAVARAFTPDAPPNPACAGDESCLELAEPAGRRIAREKHFAVLVAGAPLVRDGFVQSRGGAGIAEVRQWLEESNALLEGAAGCPGAPPRISCEGVGTCTRITVAASSRGFNDVVVALP
jgi:type II secretory pathway pseudopilin PulG